MSLTTDSIFIEALSWTPEEGSAKSVSNVIMGRLYGTAIPLPDEDMDNEPLPYVIVAFNGLSNNGQTKDNPFEGDSDNVQIGITVAASTLDALHDLTVLVRTRIRAYFIANVEDDAVPFDYQFTAGSINFDSMKPCYWQTLNYDCLTNND